MINNYAEHPWLKDYPILPEHKYLIIGTHPPMPYSGCMPFYYGNMNEFWRLLEEAYGEKLFFNSNGTPDLDKILAWLASKKLAITDMVNYTLKDYKFNTDQNIIFENYSYQLNQYLKKWLEEGNIETIFFTSFSQGKSAYGLFKKWFKLNFDSRLNDGKEIIDNGNDEFIQVNGKRIRIVMLYSPSPAARRGIPRSQPYIKWLKQNKKLKNSIDLFRIYWYRKFIMKKIENN